MLVGRNRKSIAIELIYFYPVYRQLTNTFLLIQKALAAFVRSLLPNFQTMSMQYAEKFQCVRSSWVLFVCGCLKCDLCTQICFNHSDAIWRIWLGPIKSAAIICISKYCCTKYKTSTGFRITAYSMNIFCKLSVCAIWKGIGTYKGHGS